MILDRRHRTPTRPSLASQIDEVERRLQHRQLVVRVRGAALAGTIRGTIRELIASPAMLIGAACVGFLMGEITRKPPPPPPGANPPPAPPRPFLETALNVGRLLVWAYTTMKYAGLIPSVRHRTDRSSPGR